MTPINQFKILMFVSLQIAIWGPADAAENKPYECGFASVYSMLIEETASGEDMRPEDFTAAHRTLAFGTLVQIENQENGRSTVLRITDRGPFIKGRIIDVSMVAGRELDISGLTSVCLYILWSPIKNLLRETD
jgi:rare lipoprotein A